MMNFKIKASALACISVLLVSCGGTDNDVSDDLMVDKSANGFVAQFSPAEGKIPFPSNLLFSGSADGTLNIPVANSNDYSDPKVAMNTLDGFSTVAPISTSFNLALDPSSFNGNSVRLYQVTTNAQGAVTGVVRKLTYGSDYIASLSSVDSSNKTLVISPLKPLSAKTSYLVALSNDLRSSDNRPASAELTYLFCQSQTPLVDGSGNSLVKTLSNAQASQLEPLRQLTYYQELALSSQGLDRSKVVLSWTFSTQSTSEVLLQAHTQATASASTLNAVDLGSSGPANAQVYVGSLTVPYYLKKADPLNGFWTGAAGSLLTRYNTTPSKVSDETIPLLVTTPKTGTGPWPVVIYQHGITGNRTHMLAVADTLAQAGMVAVAIDLPLHGLAPGHALNGGIERTFALDYVNNTTGAAGPDGVADASGTHFINLKNLLVSRDNNRQAVADLMALYKLLSTSGLSTGAGALNLDTSNIHFVGHSLGAIVGTPFLALEPNIKQGVLVTTGGGIAKLLDGSASYGPRIAAGLAAAGVTKGSANYESFMGAAQTVLDSTDPINYGNASSGRGLLSLMVNNDLVIPNNVTSKAPAGTAPAPLSGTEPLLVALGQTKYTTSQASTTPLNAYIRYNTGSHSSLLDPSSNLLVTTGMQTAMAHFLASAGRQLNIANSSVVE